MRVLLINGSPHREGCTYTALCEVAKALNEDGVQTEIFHIGSAPVGGCTGCGACHKTGQCVFGGSVVDVLDKVRAADGLVFGSPVHYAGAAGSMLGFMQRLAMSAGSTLRYKPAACVASARRAGTTAALDDLYKVPQYHCMPLVSGNYWPMVHGSTPADVLQDAEGLQIMRTVGHNMAWLLKSIEAGRAAGVPQPVPEAPLLRTNFIR